MAQSSCDQAIIRAIVAKLRLGKHTVHEGNFGDFTCCKYGLSRYCRNETELREFAQKLGVSS